MDVTNSHLSSSQELDESIGYETLRRMASIERYTAGSTTKSRPMSVVACFMMFCQSSEPSKQEDRLNPIWIAAILLWMSVGLGTYFFKMLTLPGRLERIAKLLQSLLN